MKTVLPLLFEVLNRKAGKKYVLYKGIILPPKNKRYLREDYFDDKLFYESAIEEGNKLTQKLGVTKKTRFLEIGCATGRSFIGLTAKIPDVYYIGIDINKKNIEWCQKYLAGNNPNYSFIHFDLRHVMYNPNGTIELNKNFRFEFDDNYFDVIYATGVIPNYTDDEVCILLKEFNRILKTGKKLFITSYVEEGVPDMEENPANYLIDYSYPRQMVRYEKKYFEKLIDGAGFKVNSFEYRAEVEKQSAYYLQKISSV